jgi:methyl-accepting chemotaxis protein-1 (serine sensor receptor)
VGELLRELTASVEAMSPGEERVEAQRLISDIQQIESLYGPVALNIVDLALNGDKDAAVVKINNDCEPLLRKLVEVVTKFIALEEKPAQPTSCIRRTSMSYSAIN